jgi:S-formylglutathione hydrolase FrmB
MKTKILSTLLLGVIFLFSCERELLINQENELAPTLKSGMICSEGTLTPVQVYSPSLEGNLLDDPALRNVNIYLPKGYNESSQKRYPVIYFLHGMPAGENSLIDPTGFAVFKAVAGLEADVDFPAEGFTEWVNNLAEEKGMKEAIIVMPNASNRYGLSFYTNSVVQGNYEDFIVKDIVSYIDANFKTIKHFKARAIVGHCMGGYGALKLAIKHPHKFGYVAALSPAHFPEETVLYCAGLMLWEDGMWAPHPPGPSLYNPTSPFKFLNNTIYGCATAWLPNPENPPFFVDLPFSYNSEGEPILDGTLMAKWNSHSLFALVSSNKPNLKKLKGIYLDCGVYDELGMTIPNQMLHQILLDMNVKHDFELYEGTHISHLYNNLGNIFVDFSKKISFNPKKHH